MPLDGRAATQNDHSGSGYEAAANAHTVPMTNTRMPVTPELRADLLERCHASGFVFGRADRKGKPPTQESVSVAFTRFSRKLKIDGVSHHVFRHTGATVMIANGVSLRAVMEIGGWTTLRQVERYAQVNDAELPRAVRITQEHTEAAKEGATAGTTGSGRKVGMNSRG